MNTFPVVRSGSMFKHQQPSGALQRHAKKVDAKARLDAAYAIVDARDGPRSRISGVYTVPFDPNPKVRREHEHLQNRSTHPELIDEPTNIYVVTAFENQLLKSGELVCEGTDATKSLRWHWDRTRVPRGKEPFQILSRRRSQRRGLQRGEE